MMSAIRGKGEAIRPRSFVKVLCDRFCDNILILNASVHGLVLGRGRVLGDAEAVPCIFVVAILKF